MRRLRITLMFFLLNRLPNGRAKDWYFKRAMKDRIFRIVYFRRIRIIAGWIRVARKSMNDLPGFIQWLQTKLPEKLKDDTAC